MKQNQLFRSWPQRLSNRALKSIIIIFYNGPIVCQTCWPRFVYLTLFVNLILQQASQSWRNLSLIANDFYHQRSTFCFVSACLTYVLSFQNTGLLFLYKPIARAEQINRVYMCQSSQTQQTKLNTSSEGSKNVGLLTLLCCCFQLKKCSYTTFLFVCISVSWIMEHEWTSNFIILFIYS